MPFGIQPIHLVVIAVVALLIFGPKRLPEIGRSIGRSINEFRKGASEMTDSFRQEVSNPQADNKNAISQPTPSASMDAQTGESANARFCVKCGTSNLSDALFCKKCGSQMPA